MPTAQGCGRRRAWHQAPAGQDASGAAQLQQPMRNRLAGPRFRSRQRWGRPTESSSLSSPAPRRCRDRGIHRDQEVTRPGI